MILIFKFVLSLNVDKFGFMNVFCSTELFHVDFLKITADFGVVRYQPLIKILWGVNTTPRFQPKIREFCF